ncbi:TPA: 50S ribosomal protein L35 [Patescibacteria group bacterium]|uniref:Large ribosomal subunit protein bL35 n=1 Tax=candidate division Kazan bacterium GW2011_GWA1_50_15 TaxID=1620412 RepID=A0A0G4BBL6_UNCK3|nr:MAG: 50S ribosomal protein L35, large subunit ribosomal protein L35 [candidate division Kazan bacterium GW2011_GWA1_50_15]HAV65896.1 50S ribosomal protein L35 [Patescibacteria group bacterium]HCL47873.1 50S ribosomal protein L35 [Patescibacteria group bacterium]HCR42858.1 50S ribosomal protein L35 [Patescibacteria group bacterium]
MPKLKVHQGTAKRIRITKSGKLKRRQAMQAHKLTKKSAARKRRLARPADVTRADEGRIRRLLGR